LIQQEQKQYEESNKKTIKTKNPATEEIVDEYDILNKQQINEATKKAKDAYV
jgi:acyl-CoA reductase-like NAD-dependent aldehyde dehydrogenase